MPEQLTEQQLEALFAGLRADTITGIRPPGAGEARQTVCRRRTAHTIAATSLAVLVIAGFVLTMSRAAPSRHPTGQAAAAPLTWAELQGLASHAHAAVASVPMGYGEVDHQEVVAQSSFPLSEKFNDDAGFALSGMITTHWYAASSGTYRTELGCAGHGHLTVRVLSSASTASTAVDVQPDEPQVTEAGSVRVRCDPSTSVMTMTFVQPTSGFLRITAVADAEARERSGFAFSIARENQPVRNTATAKAALNAANPHLTAWIATVSPTGAEAVNHGAGTAPRSMQVVCVGSGTIVVNLTPDETSSNARPVHKEITCSPTATIQSFAVPFAAPTEVHWAVEADAVARARSGYALVLRT